MSQGEGSFDTDTQDEDPVVTEADTGEIHYKLRNAKDWQQPVDTRRNTWNRFFLRTSRRKQPD